MRRPWRSKFDAEKDFVVRRPLTVGGRKFAPGEFFDRTLVNTRRLRQLFDARIIHFTEESPGARVRAWNDPHRRRPGDVDGDLPPELIAEEDEEETAEELAARARAEVLATRAAVEIPEGWEALKWPARLKLAASLSDSPIKNAVEAAAAINAEIARRGTP